MTPFCCGKKIYIVKLFGGKKLKSIHSNHFARPAKQKTDVFHVALKHKHRTATDGDKKKLFRLHGA